MLPVVSGILLLSGLGKGTGIAAQDRFDQDALLEFENLGSVTLMHIGDLLGQIVPQYHRPAEVNIGVAEGADKMPYLTGEAFRIRYGIGGGTPMDYAFTHENFTELAKVYGKIGGLDRVATVLNAIRSARSEALFLQSAMAGRDAGVKLGPNRMDLAPVTNALLPDFVPNQTAVDAVTAPHIVMERGGVMIGVIDPNLPTPSDNRHKQVQRAVDVLREQAADQAFSADLEQPHTRDMLRVGGLGFTLAIENQTGERISDLTVLASGAALDPEQTYTVTGWSTSDDGAQGPPLWEVLERYIRRQRRVGTIKVSAVTVETPK